MPVRDFLYFKSNGKMEYRPLSNFMAAPIQFTLNDLPVYASLLSPNLDRAQLPDVLHFPCTEHAWQALKADDSFTFSMFLTGGHLAALTPDVITALTTKADWGKKSGDEFGRDKVAYYRTGGLEMVGAVAKFAATVERGRMHGYSIRGDREFLAADVEAAVWHELLMTKFRQNSGPRQVLLATGDQWLVEHDKGARLFGSHWGGLVNTEDGSLIGQNKMGLFLEHARAALQRDFAEEWAAVQLLKKRGTKRARSSDTEAEAEAVAKRRRLNKIKVLDGTQSQMLIDDANGAQVSYEPAFLSADEATAAFQALMTETPWAVETLHRWNKDLVTPRRVYAFGDPNVNYRYISLNRVGAEWTPTMRAIKEKLEAHSGVTFNFCFVNLYRDGLDMISEHSDDEKSLIPGHEIDSITLSPNGGERDLLFKHKDVDERLMIKLAHGSLYRMKGTTQKYYKHAIPRRPKVTQPRINLTFRQVRVDDAPVEAPVEAPVL